MRLLLLIFLSFYSLLAREIELEVLGSGGPEIDGRASTSYLLYIDKKARLLVDMGSGSMLRFEQSGAKLKDLEAIVLTHLHIDHSVDLPSYVKAGYFSYRKQKLDIIGPFGNEYFPSINEFLENLFGKNGAFRYMKDILTNKSNSFQIVPVEIAQNKFFTKIYKDFKLTLLSVNHGFIPALALKIEVDNKIIVISGDTNNANKHLNKLSKNANLLIAHHAISNLDTGFATKLHMRPSDIADIASELNIKTLLLTHRMKRTIGLEDESLKVIRKKFKSKVIFAEDRMKVKL